MPVSHCSTTGGMRWLCFIWQVVPVRHDQNTTTIFYAFPTTITKWQIGIIYCQLQCILSASFQRKERKVCSLPHGDLQSLPVPAVSLSQPTLALPGTPSANSAYMYMYARRGVYDCGILKPHIGSGKSYHQ